MTRYLTFFIIYLSSQFANAQVKYAEIYRPQFHASPSSGFMGDPNGPMKYDSLYHLFWWGHLTSKDLVFWKELNKNALNGTPAGYGNWSGSVVMDLENTSGFGLNGKPAMIAVYTLNNNSNGHQSQAISYSLNYSSFDYYSGNPVIFYENPDFRDPQVFWHEGTQKWVMVITKPVDRAIEIFSSSDLKAWTYQSTFKGRGAEKEVWEVPDLFEVPLNGDPNNQKWVMTCGMGPNKMQFWVGSFDGQVFTLDENENLLTGNHIPGELFSNFETSFSGWTVEGEAFGSGPASGALANQQEVNGFTGFGFVNSFHQGDASVGKLISPEFEITKRFINFQIGGGTGNGLRLKVIVNGVEVAGTVGTSNTETLIWRGLNVSDWIGQIAHIEIVDEATGGWGHILVDHITFSDVLFDTRLENANWADWGLDFYAGKSFRNYDFDDNRKIWLAWMGNWAYAKNVPTRPWQGCQSIPRELELINNGKGYQLIQKPIVEFQKLRQTEFSKSNLSVIGSQILEDFTPQWNVYEMKISFKIDNKDQKFGLVLAEGEGHKITIKYDASSSNLFLTRSINTFYFASQRESKAPIHIPEDSILDLHIFLDQSSIEVLANDYQTSMTTLAFNDVTTTGVTLFSETGLVEVKEIKAWNLESIWGITADEMERPDNPDEPLGMDDIPKIISYPNPIFGGDVLKLKLAEMPDTVALLDTSGKTISVFMKPENSEIRIPDNIKPGLYFLNIHHQSKLISLKIIIE